jgi:hypothetical protein
MTMVTPARPRPRPPADPGRRVSGRLAPAGSAALAAAERSTAGRSLADPVAERASERASERAAGSPLRLDEVVPPLPTPPYRSYGPSAAARAAAGRRLSYRRRRAAVLAVLLAATGLVFVDLVRGDMEERRRDPAPAAVSPKKAAQGGASGAASEAGPTAATTDPGAGERDNNAVAFPVTGSGRFGYAAGRSPVLGRAGTVRRFQVAVEGRTGQSPATFARAVDEILADPRGWTASGRLRLQRVPRGAPAHFTIFLATPGTSERMCAAGGLYTERFTSCRLPGRVVINLARWRLSVPGYGASLAEYQAYAINHEVGHELGYGHETCPAPGVPAPVMQQQTLGLRGCAANSWPYLNGRRYAGSPVP